MRIKMLTTQRGSPDGVQVNTYEADETYEVPDGLGGVFVREGWAEEVAAPVPEPEAKDAGAPPENKGGTAKPPQMSPAVRKLVEEHGIDAATIEGTGKNGAIKKADVLRAVEAAAKS